MEIQGDERSYDSIETFSVPNHYSFSDSSIWLQQGNSDLFDSQEDDTTDYNIEEFQIDYNECLSSGLVSALNFDFIEEDFELEETEKDTTSTANESIDDNYNYESELWIYEALNLELYLETIFPDQIFSSNVIYEALCLSGGDYNKVIEIINYANYLVDNCKPCRHMLTSKCYRKDCTFHHDVSAVPCRYWMGPIGCATAKEGGHCPFLHQLPSEYDHSYLYAKYSSTFLPNQLATQPLDTNQALQEMDFPELAPSSSNEKSKSKTRVPQYKKSTDDQNLTESQRLFKSLFGNQSYAVNLRTQLEEEEKRHEGKKDAVITLKSIEMNWVQTGKDISVQYAQLRKDARLVAIMRNRCLEAATKAYLSGSKDRAKLLSENGQHFNARMKQLHKQAARIIFSKRNKVETLLSGVVDLHGLHVNEARELLNDLLPTFCPHKQLLRSSGYHGGHNSSFNEDSVDNVPSCLNAKLSHRIRATNLQSIVIITGTGHHTIGAKSAQESLSPSTRPRLFNSVKQLLQEYEMNFQVVRDANGFDGAFRVSTR